MLTPGGVPSASVAPSSSVSRIKLAAAHGARLLRRVCGGVQVGGTALVRETPTGWGPARTAGRTGRILLGHSPGVGGT